MQNSSVITVDKEEYEREGYTIIRGMLDKHSVNQLSERLNMAARGQLDSKISRQIEPGQVERAKSLADPLPLVRKVWHLAVNDPFFRDLVNRDEFLTVARHIMGDDLYYLGDEAQLKPPRFGSAHPWHQDAPYYINSGFHHEFLTIWVAVDAATVENGCMEVIPRSHLAGVVNRADNTKAWFEEGELDTTDALSAVLEAGDALFFHSNTIHGSGPNRTDFARRSMIFRYFNKNGMTPGEWKCVDERLGGDLREGWNSLPVFRK